MTESSPLWRVIPEDYPSPVDWALAQDALPEDDRAVLVLLARNATTWDCKRAAPDLDVMALVAGMKKRRVSQSLKRLEERGLIVTEGRVYGHVVRRLMLHRVALGSPPAESPLPSAWPRSMLLLAGATCPGRD